MIVVRRLPETNNSIIILLNPLCTVFAPFLVANEVLVATVCEKGETSQKKYNCPLFYSR
jgi:hypothetical protein